MSQLTRGPLPPSVYWRRRVAALLAVSTVVALVVGLARLATGGHDDPAQVALTGTAPTAAASTGPTTLVDPDASEGAGEDADASADTGTTEQRGQPGKRGKRGDRAAEPVLPEPQGTCAEEDVVVKPRVDDAVAGQPVTVVLTLRTVLAEACTWELSRSTFTWKITSGDDEIWTSRECPRGVASRELVLRRDTTTQTELVWGGRRSDAECSRLTDWAMPGWYHATVSPLAGEPKDTQFELRTPAPATVTADPEPRRKKNRR